MEKSLEKASEFFLFNDLEFYQKQMWYLREGAVKRRYSTTSVEDFDYQDQFFTKAINVIYEELNKRIEKARETNEKLSFGALQIYTKEWKEKLSVDKIDELNSHLAAHRLSDYEEKGLDKFLKNNGYVFSLKPEPVQ